MIEPGTREITRAIEAQSAAAGVVGTRATRKPQRELGSLARAIAAEPVRASVSPVVLAGAIRLLEFALIGALGFAVYLLYLYADEGFALRYVAASLAIAGAAVAAFHVADLYDVATLRTHVHQLSRLGVVWAAIFLLAFAVAFFAKFEGMYSRVWAASFFGTGLFMLYGLRLITATLVRHWTREGRLVRRTVIVGGGGPGESLIHALEAQRDSDLDIRGVFDDRGDDRSPARVADVPKLGTVDDLVEFARRTRIDLLFVSLPITAEERVLQMVRKLWVLPVDIRLAAHTSKLRFRPRAYSYIGNVPVLDVFDKPIADWNFALKWLFDRIVGGLLLLARCR